MTDPTYDLDPNEAIEEGYDPETDTDTDPENDTDHPYTHEPVEAVGVDISMADFDLSALNDTEEN